MQITSHIILDNISSVRADLYSVVKDALSTYSDIYFNETNLEINNIKHQHGRYLVRFTLTFDSNLSEEDNSIVETIFETLSTLIPSDSNTHGLFKFFDENQLGINQNLYAMVYKTEMKIREILFFILWNKYGSREIYQFLSRFGNSFNLDPSKKFKKTFDHQLFYIMFSKYKELTKYQNLNTFSIPNSKESDNEKYLSKIINKYKSIDELVVYLKSIWIDEDEHISILRDVEAYLDSIEKLRNAIAHNRHIEQEIIDNAIPAMEAVNDLITKYWDKWSYTDISIKEEIIRWFFDNYVDPANGVPYNSHEGGYQYWNGGPYDAKDEIEEMFPDVDEEIINSSVEEIELEGHEWVKRGEY